MSTTTIQDQIAGFLTELELRAASPDTYRTRATHLRAFDRWSSERHITDLHALSRDVVLRWLAECRAGGSKAATICVKASAVKAFLRWLEEERRIERVPRIVVPKPRREAPSVLTSDQIERVLRAIDDEPDAHAARDRALIELLWGSGIRCGEAHLLNVADLDLDAASGRVNGKGGKVRSIFLTRAAVAAIREYLSHHRTTAPGADSQAALFTSYRGRRLGRNVIHSIVRRRAEAAGLTGVHPHQLRHSFATSMLVAGAGLRTVQEALGHSSISTTEVYTHLSPSFIRDELRRCHPRERAAGA